MKAPEEESVRMGRRVGRWEKETRTTACLRDERGHGVELREETIPQENETEVAGQGHWET